MKVYDVAAEEFAKYGRVVTGYDFSELISRLKQIPMPGDVYYTASDPELEKLEIFEEFQRRFFGGLPAELGYCMGHNRALNGLEYHRGSEVNIAASDYVVMVGMQQDLDEDFNYDTGRIEAFYVHEGQAVEFYATTLHYCACNTVPAGYVHGTFLPRGTNTPLEEGFAAVTAEDRLLAARNKWLIAHPDGGQGADVHVGLHGRNWTIDDCEIQ